jgi:cation diffusion facilitator CzcD-associated flavoprotein CzcO
MTDTNNIRVAIIGAGITGLAAGRELLEQGFTDFTIFEKAKAVGGTWHIHTYPGLACDVWSHSYTFSYAPNPNWSQAFVNQPEIENYLQQCAQDFGLESHMRFNSTITEATLTENKQWQLQLADGHTDTFDVIINAMGNQHTPIIPSIKGLETFKGNSWHSTNWDHNVDLEGKRVVVIGSAAAAIQIIPEIAEKAKHVTVLQRSANWIMPRKNKTYSPLEKKLFAHAPLFLRGVQAIQKLLMGFIHGGATLNSRAMKLMEGQATKFVKETISDPELQDAVIPTGPYGCKRPLVSADYYPALTRSDVTLLHTGAEEITETACITAEGDVIEADVIIYCTGYKVMDFDRIKVTGEEGNSLTDTMAQAPEAYMGIAVPGFPNYFLPIGPNAMVISASYFRSVEPNVKNIVNLLSSMRAKKVKAIGAKAELTQQYNEWVRSESKQFAWDSGQCSTYYVNEAGHSLVLYPGDYKSFLKMRKSCEIEKFEQYS